MDFSKANLIPKMIAGTKALVIISLAYLSLRIFLSAVKERIIVPIEEAK